MILMLYGIHLRLTYIDLLIHMSQLNNVSLEIYMSLSGLMMKPDGHVRNSKSSTTAFKSLVILITWLNIKNYAVVIKNYLGN